MRRVELEVKDKAQINAIIEKCDTIRIGIIADGMPYIVPLVFAHEWSGEMPRFFFHAGVSGRKKQGFQDGARVCFEMDIPGPLMESRTKFANNFSKEFCCVMGEGVLRMAMTEEEKINYFGYIMRKHTGRDDYEYQPGWLALTNVFMLDVDTLSASQKGMHEGAK